MLRVAVCAAFVAGLASACLHDDLVPCGDNLCPVGYVCTTAGVCADPASAEACNGKADGDTCTIDGKDGTCSQGACHAAGCGNGILDQGEVCDDGNNALGDGCSADCLSNETCGNGVTDPIKGEQCDTGVAGQSADGCSSRCKLEIEIWRDISPDGIGSVSNARLVYDSVRGVSVLYGGYEHGFRDTAWEWDGVGWRARTSESAPELREGEGLAYDASRHRTVLFGGLNVFTAKFGDTWEWDGVQWIDKAPAITPSPRGDVAMAYDPARQRVVLFGGAGESALLDDTWEWDGTSWTQPAITGLSPSARQGAALSFDPVSGKLVLFGGLDVNGAPLADTWTFDGTTWASLTPATSPSVRWGAAIATCGNEIVLFGGSSSAFGPPVGDSWQWNGSNWISFTSAQMPAARCFAAFAYDSVRGRCVLYGGGDSAMNYGDTWELAGTTWAQVPFEYKPRQRYDHGLAYDPLRGRVVLFSGRVSGSPSQDTWEWDGLNWMQKRSSAPPIRSSATLVYDERLRQVVVFGGGTLAAGNDLWGWNGSQWSPLPDATPPPGRQEVGLAYDRDRDRIVMFGGNASGTPMADTWEWDGAGWTDRTPSTGPSPRKAPTLAYDPIRHRTVLVGGTDDITFANDVWEWDGTTWTKASTSLATPASRIGAAYDVARQRVFGFGGSSYFGSTIQDSFEFDGTVDLRTPAVVPSVRGTPLAYDAIAHRAILFGGTAPKTTLNDTWGRDYENPASTREACIHADADTDGDTLVGCADPDCQGRCNPLCPPGVTCDANAPHCGDSTCGAVEDYLICPSDCSPP